MLFKLCLSNTIILQVLVLDDAIESSHPQGKISQQSICNYYEFLSPRLSLKTGIESKKGDIMLIKRFEA
jgi:hypothetical protein